ncbi:MAG: CvpA family protein [Bacteroidia bacterium]|nr:CvpA family protein [Bacteroidia bacterium]
MNYLDFIFLVPLVWGAYRGFTKGFIISLASVAALLLGIYCAFRLSGFTANIMEKQLHWHPDKVKIIAFAITFIVILVGVHLLAKLLDKLLSSVSLGWLNRILGLFFGVLKYAFLLSVLLVLLAKMETRHTLIPAADKEKSYLYKPLSRLFPGIFPYFNFNEYQIFDHVKPTEKIVV